jgi:hypothetical protein
MITVIPQIGDIFNKELEDDKKDFKKAKKLMIVWKI